MPRKRESDSPVTKSPAKQMRKAKTETAEAKTKLKSTHETTRDAEMEGSVPSSTDNDKNAKDDSTV